MISCVVCFSLPDVLNMIISSCVHVAADDVVIFMAEECSMVYMYHMFFIHSSANGHVLALVNRAAVNAGGIYPFE